MRIWADTDFGFDDLWALLLLEHLIATIDGVSLVAGNTPMPQVTRNALACVHAFEFAWPVYCGATKPLQREPETAERILGKQGMCSRGVFPPYDAVRAGDHLRNEFAIDAMAGWLSASDEHYIIALGPLTNLAMLVLQRPEAAVNIDQITWLGGSSGRGNHSPYAEFNALADPEALAVVTDTNIPFSMIDLELCRQVSFAEADMPTLQGANKQLLTDLLGGYLDIALQRGRSTMSIYDPLAAMSVARDDLFEFVPASLSVDTTPGEAYGQTVVGTNEKVTASNFEVAVSVNSQEALNICLSALIHA